MAKNNYRSAKNVSSYVRVSLNTSVCRFLRGKLMSVRFTFLDMQKSLFFGSEFAEHTYVSNKKVIVFKGDRFQR